MKFTVKAVENLDCELVYDHWSEQKKIYELEEKEKIEIISR